MLFNFTIFSSINCEIKCTPVRAKLITINFVLLMRTLNVWRRGFSCLIDAYAKRLEERV